MLGAERSGEIMSPEKVSVPFNLDHRWALNPQVNLRRERFGALAYNFGNRRLTLLSDAVLAAVVAGIEDHPDARHALTAAGVPPSRFSAYIDALERLAQAEVIHEID